MIATTTPTIVLLAGGWIVVATVLAMLIGPRLRRMAPPPIAGLPSVSELASARCVHQADTYFRRGGGLLCPECADAFDEAQAELEVAAFLRQLVAADSSALDELEAELDEEEGER